jgi:hypothetical protein
LRIGPEETIAAVQSSGLTFKRRIDVPPYHYAVVFSCEPGA